MRDALLARYAEPQRAYHTLQHLRECLDLFEEAEAAARAGPSGAEPVSEHPAEVELALWFHDAIYDIPATDNEQRSADWARAALATASAPPDAGARVHALVMATRHDAAPTGADAQLLVDIDLAILGAPAARFAEYEMQIRREYAHVPEAAFRQRRRTILRSFLERAPLYATAFVRDRREVAARVNLRRAVEETWAE